MVEPEFEFVLVLRCVYPTLDEVSELVEEIVEGFAGIEVVSRNEMDEVVPMMIAGNFQHFLTLILRPLYNKLPLLLNRIPNRILIIIPSPDQKLKLPLR